MKKNQWKIIDNITSEEFLFNNQIDAEWELRRRLEVHNSTWYCTRYVHEPKNAKYTLDGHIYTIFKEKK